MNFRFFSGVLSIGLLIGLTGCQPDKPKWDNTKAIDPAADDPVNAPLANHPEEGLGGPGANGKWVESTSNVGGADANGWVPADPSGNRLNMPVIYFAYDSDLLVPSEAAKVERIAAYLAQNPTLGLLVEGHCDQRGTEEYNRALGERRANAIRAALEKRGLESGRIKTISYGEDKPAVLGNGEGIWKQNRRGVPVPMIMPR